ncbi:MAG: EcsC family protein [Sakamotonia sp.]|jgi:hypothetical protein
MKFIKKTPVILELEKIEKEEKRLEQRALSHTEPGWKAALAARIPPAVSENLQKAFCMAFRTIFEKGNPLIEKTYRRDELEKDFKVRDFSLDLKESRKEYKKLRTEAARRNLKKQAVSAAEGLGLGLLGVGLPDIAIFTAMLLRGVYETALYFGFSYDTPGERFFILCLLEASVSRGEQWAENNARVDRLIYTLVQRKERTISEEELEAQIQAAGNAFAMDMLAAKFIQGLPVVGALGGLSDPVCWKQVMTYVQLKYRKRYLMGKTG